jgi:hypothetical protein
MAIALILLTFLAVEPKIAYSPLIWRKDPRGGAFAVARHGELMGNRGTTFTVMMVQAARTGFLA